MSVLRRVGVTVGVPSTRTTFMKQPNTNPKPPAPVTYEDRVKAFQESEKRKKAAEPKKSSAPASNPYVRAREEVLEGYVQNNRQWRKAEVLSMEAKGDTDNRHYLDFVKEVARRGDELSNETEPKSKPNTTQNN